MTAALVGRSVAWLARPAALPSKVRRSLRRFGALAKYRDALRDGELLVEAGPLPAHGLITVAMPVFRVSEDHLRAAIESVRAQSWPDWELVAVDDAAPDPHVARVLAEVARDPRIRIVRRTSNGGVSAASNDAVAQARGEFVAFLDHDDQLHPRALELVARFLGRHPESDWLFTDEDKLDRRGIHCEPMLKPGWSHHLLLGFNIASHLRVVRRAAIERVGGHRPGYEGAQDYDLALRILDAGGHFEHLPGPLYHWRGVPGSMARAASAKPRANARAAAALLEHARRFPRGGAATAEALVDSASLFHVRRVAEASLSLAVAVRGPGAFDRTGAGPHAAHPLALEEPSDAALVAAARGSSDDVVLVPPATGMTFVEVAELLSLLQVPGTALAAARRVQGRRVTESGRVVTDGGDVVDPWAGLAVSDPGYLNLALLPGRRALPPPSGWAAWRSSLVAAWDAAPDVPESWRLPVGWARLGLEAVTTPNVSLGSAAPGFPLPRGPIPEELPRSPVSGLARLGLLP